MKIITRERVKELLGIADTTYDNAIDAAIPVVDSAIKLITRNRYNYQVILSTNSTVYAEIYRVWNGYGVQLQDLENYIQVGQKIEGEGISSGTYIDEVYYNGQSVEFDGVSYSVPCVKLSDTATNTKVDNQCFTGIPIGFDIHIAKGVWWYTQQINTSIVDNTWTSKSIGKLSISKGGSQSDNQLDGKSGFPLWFVRGFPHYMGGY
jgi:hypothetical protein